MKTSMRSLLLVLFIALITPYIPAATVDGVPIHSTLNGTGSKAVILIHGWTCDTTSWDQQIPALSKNYKVVAIDLPGHGKSGLPKQFSMDVFSRAIEAVRSEYKIERAVFAGHSMGSPVILHYLQKYPQHVAGLVFVDGSITPPAAGSNSNFADQFAGPNGPKARESFIKSMFSAATTPEMQKHILSMMLSAPEQTAVNAIKAAMDPTSYKSEIVTLPALGIYQANAGGMDDYMKTHYPNLEYHKVPGTGHFLMMEKPDEFNRLLLAFLDKLKY
jgi:sigma-B regulation protein RsbQ